MAYHTALPGCPIAEVRGGGFSSSGGGGNSYIYGALYVVGSVTTTANSGVTVFYNQDAGDNIATTKIILARESWRGILDHWPSGL
ncbi:MAG: hypothetical protein ABII00_14835 [Elusimicrobiota bacterium]